MKNNSLILSFFISSILMFSCQKDEPIKTTVAKQNMSMVLKHFIDDISVSEDDFENQTMDMFLVEFHKSSSDLKSSFNEDEALVEKRAYTSEEKYVAFGKEHGLDFDKQLVLEKIMSNYAEKSGAIAEFERTGKLPTWYIEREQLVYDSLFNDNSNLKSTQVSLFITLFKDHFVPGVGAGSSVIMPKTLPFMYPGWNNKVSCVEFVGIGGSLVIYDKTFYRKRLSTIVNWGMTKINLGPGVNDRMSSGVSFF